MTEERVAEQPLKESHFYEGPIYDASWVDESIYLNGLQQIDEYKLYEN